MLAMEILAEAAGGNGTNGTNATDPPTLQDRGVNVDHWPFYEPVKNKKHSYNDTSPDEAGAEGGNATNGTGELRRLVNAPSGTVESVKRPLALWSL